MKIIVSRLCIILKDDIFTLDQIGLDLRKYSRKISINSDAKQKNNKPLINGSKISFSIVRSPIKQHIKDYSFKHKNDSKTKLKVQMPSIPNIKFEKLQNNKSPQSFERSLRKRK